MDARLKQTEEDIAIRCHVVDKGLKEGVFTAEEARARKQAIYDSTIVMASGPLPGVGPPPPNVTSPQHVAGGKAVTGSTTSTRTGGGRGRAPSERYNAGYAKGKDPRFHTYRDDEGKTGAYYYIVRDAAKLEGLSDEEKEAATKYAQEYAQRNPGMGK